MRREEEIAAAFYDYSDALKLSTFGDFEYIDIQGAFEEGAEWADNHPKNVWHDASDNPTEDTLILYRTTSGECGVTEFVCTSEGVWHLFVKEYEVAEWAYISDLLPKGGEK